MTRTYEVAVVLNPELATAEVEKILHSLKATIQKYGGKVTEEDSWGRKPTAYVLAGHKEAYYTFYTVELGPENVTALDQDLRLNTNVIRHLITIHEENDGKEAHGDTLSE